jgi:peptidoglycan/xylan/chitin deacetylase (PgdA/CDA1 family)
MPDCKCQIQNPEPSLSLLARIPNKREFLARSFGSLGILRLLEGLAAARSPALAVFTYHRIAVPGVASDDYYDPVISATPEAFRAQVRFLRERFAVVHLEELAALGGSLRPDRKRPAALITFDDGYCDNFRTALPILRELGVPAAFFLPTSYLQAPRLPWWDHAACAIKRTRVPRLVLERSPGDLTPIAIDLGTSPSDAERTAAIMTIIRAFLDRTIPEPSWFLDQLGQQAGVAIDTEARGRSLFMGWNEVRQLLATGMAVGSHGHAHVALAGLDDDAQRRELAGSKAALEEALGCEVTAIAYPFGWPGTFTRRTTELAAEAGYRLAFSSLEGVNRPGRPGFEPMALRRLNVGTGDSPPLLRARAALHAALGRSVL